MRTPLAIAAFASVVGAARPSRAVERSVLVVSPGYVYSDARTATAHGFELSAHWLRKDSPVGLGAFGQVQRYSDRSVRFAGGAQATFSILGLELGYAHRGEGEAPAPRPDLAYGLPAAHTTIGSTSGVHVAPFVSLGFVYFAYRWTLPLARGPSPAHGAESAFTVGVKIPIPTSGDLLRGLEGVVSPPWH